MDSKIWMISVASLPLVLLACSGEDGGSEATGGTAPAAGGSVGGLAGTGGLPGDTGGAANGSGGAGTPSAQCLTETNADGNLVLNAEPQNNYSFSSSLSVSVTPVAPNSELFFDWSGLTHDFVSHPVDPATDIDMLSVIVWNVGHDEMTELLNNDQLGPSYVNSPSAFYNENDVTSASIFEFVVPGGGEMPREDLMSRLNPELFDPELHTYTVMPAQGGIIGQGVKMVQAFRLDPTSTNQTVPITSESTSLTYQVDLTSLTPIGLPPARANVLVDWAAIQTNAMGRLFKLRSINEVMVAYYDLTPEELEAEFLDLELIASRMWRGPVPAGDSILLSNLTNEAGEAFAGIDSGTTGTWILALICGTCGNPAPWYITRLETCSE